MEEKNGQEKIQKLDVDELEQAAGGAIWFDALEAGKGIKKSKKQAAESEKKPGPVAGAVGGISSGAEKIKERLEKFARN
jgi:hypothetical protein